MKKLKQKGGVREMLISGAIMRSLYNGFSAMIFFTLLQQFALPLKVDITMYDE